GVDGVDSGLVPGSLAAHDHGPKCGRSVPARQLGCASWRRLYPRIAAVRVRDPQDRRWRVRRRWTPWRRRVRNVDPLDALSMPSLPGGDDPISIILTVLGLIVLIPVVILLALALLEVLLLLLLIPVPV
ncbi:MAG: hypothetical protein JWN20_2054, partial [Jatrophihabitantaceae bacterium]|nr:hypothetical protein [Jatrophihabitantaceae bacterium]